MLIEERNDHTDSVEVCVVEFGPTARVSDIRYCSLHRYQVTGVTTEPVRSEQVLVLVGLLLGDVESLALLPGADPLPLQLDEGPVVPVQQAREGLGVLLNVLYPHIVSWQPGNCFRLVSILAFDLQQ